jgi:hypothetical protein
MVSVDVAVIVGYTWLVIYFCLAIGYTACLWVIGLLFRVDEPVQFAVAGFWYTFLAGCAVLFLLMAKVLILG